MPFSIGKKKIIWKSFQKIKRRNGPSYQNRCELEREKMTGAVDQEKSKKQIEKIVKQF